MTNKKKKILKGHGALPSDAVLSPTNNWEVTIT